MLAQPLVAHRAHRRLRRPSADDFDDGCDHREPGKGHEEPPKARQRKLFSMCVHATFVFKPYAKDDAAKVGGQGRNRTSDTRIFSAVLYQLSYLAWKEFRGVRNLASIPRPIRALTR